MSKKKKDTQLTKDEMVLLQKVLYQSRWSGEQWEKMVRPLINKLAKMTDEQEK